MADKVNVDPDQLRAAAQKTQHVSDRISDTLCTLQSAADGLGSPWGNDSYGSQFANGTKNNGYLAAVATLHSLTRGLSDHAGTHADGQVDSAKFHETGEERSAHSFERE